MTHGAIILCGGQSVRMGRDKAMLPFGPNEVMLQRVIRLVGETVKPARIVVVAAVGQDLPNLEENVQIVRDRRPERGPLEGLAAGLRALSGRADAAFVTSCDVPLVKPAFIERLFELLRSDGMPFISGSSSDDGGGGLGASSDLSAVGCVEIVVPREDRFHHPLSAVYRTNVLAAVDDLLAADRLRMRFLFEACKTLEVQTDDLRDVDPELDSLANCNRPDEYAAALARCGLETH